METFAELQEEKPYKAFKRKPYKIFAWSNKSELIML